MIPRRTRRDDRRRTQRPADRQIVDAWPAWTRAADTRLGLLYEAGKIFAEEDDARIAFDRVLPMLHPSLPFVSVIAVEQGDGVARVTRWPTSASSRNGAALAKARATFAYLADRGAWSQGVVEETRRAIPAQVSLPSTGAHHLAFPLAVGRPMPGLPSATRTFGIVQLELAAPPTREQVTLASALANQLARAVARQMDRQRDAEARTTAELQARQYRALGDEQAAHEHEHEQRLREKLEFTRAITASIGEGIIAIDRAGVVTFVNDAAAEMLGHSWRDMRGGKVESFARFVFDDGTESSPIDWVDVGRSVASDQLRLVRPDGTSFTVDVNVAPIRARTGTSAGTVIAFADNTERMRMLDDRLFLLRATRELAASPNASRCLEQLTRACVPRLGDVCFVDVVTPRGLRRVAWAHTSPQGQRLLDAAYADVEELVDDRVSDCIEGRTHSVTAPTPIAEPWFTGDAAVLTLSLDLGPRSVGALTLIQFDPRAHNARADLALAEELVHPIAFAIENARLFADTTRAVRVREQILGVVAHDLRGPLSAILLATTLLGARDEGERRTRLPSTADRIMRNARRMTRLVDDLLDFASMEAGTLSIRRSQESPASIVTEAAAIIESSARAQHVALEVLVGDGLCDVACDADRVLQVIGNLTSNALKVTPAGGTVTIGVAAISDGALFSVTDNGPGIAPAMQRRIFERFWRGTSSYRGTGLGLTIAKGIVEAHGGRIWAESAVGKGTSIFFTIPR